MMQLLTEREAEFLAKLRTLIIEYNAEIHSPKAGEIQLVVDAHLNPDWTNPIAFGDCMDETNIDDLLEETSQKTRLIIEKHSAAMCVDISDSGGRDIKKGATPCSNLC